MSNPLQEKLLLYRARVKKDPEAFGKIYDLYARRIYRFIYFKVSSVEEAQDLTSDVFLKVWSYLLDERDKNVRHLGALLYGIARNRVVDHYRSKAGHETVPLPEEAEEQIADTRLESVKADAKIDVDMLERHLRSLKDEYREVLVMKYLDELETSEIAKLLGKTQGNVRVLLHRALETVRGLVAQHSSNNEHELHREAIEGAER